MSNNFTPDVIIVGHGLAGLVAAYEITKSGKRVLIVDQETEENLGGQAFWSLGGLFFINSSEQRRMGIKDSFELAYQDWMGTAGFDREEDYWPKKWAEAYLHFAAGEKYQYVKNLGISFFPVVGWAERGDGTASGHGNSVPRFHISWGTGTGVVKPFVEQAREAEKKGLLKFAWRHKVTDLLMEAGAVVGLSGTILAPDNKRRGEKTNRSETGNFEFRAAHVILASGGIGANAEMVRNQWPKRLGNPPKYMIQGVPDYVDGSMYSIAEAKGSRIINKDRMWHYTEGIHNWDPIWSNHAIRILPGPSSIWLDAKGNRLPAPYLPGFDSLGTLNYIMNTGYEYTWFILTQKIIKKEFALSGSEQNPDLTHRDYAKLLKRLGTTAAPDPVEAFKKHGKDFIVANTLEELVQGMNTLTGENLLDVEHIRTLIQHRDNELNNKFSKDIQINYIRSTRKYLGDKLIRTAKPHKLLDPKNGPLIAVRLNLLTRKTLGGFETNLNGQVFGLDGNIIPGLYAAGEASGFGGGGMHGYRALEGTFLGGCIFSGKQAGQFIAKQ